MRKDIAPSRAEYIQVQNNTAVLDEFGNAVDYARLTPLRNLTI